MAKSLQRKCVPSPFPRPLNAPNQDEKHWDNKQNKKGFNINFQELDHFNVIKFLSYRIYTRTLANIKRCRPFFVENKNEKVASKAVICSPR